MRRQPLTREMVLRAALDLADQGGLESLTMQNIGQRLGVKAMSLYRHVANKDDILDGLVDLIVSDIDLPASGADWKTALRQRAISARQVFARRRWAIGLVESRTRPGAATLRHHESVLGVLLEAGFSSEMSAHAYNLLDSYIYGFALQEANLPFDTPEQQAQVAQVMLQELPADEYPNMARVATAFIESGADYGAEFEFGLDLILDGIERARAEV
ncbi:MAG: TetR/AcrR family transcriptional regulator C-terminal domain-containing protein [Chloroflexota bacterium]|nr:TetR/AcrR family transcriptional regulator C-terminal domain-containing protein [Chloroflexota bacterium]